MHRGRAANGSRVDFLRIDSIRPRFSSALSTDGEKLQLLEKMLDRRASAERLEQLEQRALLRRAREALLALRESREVLAQRDDTVRLARRRAAAPRR